MASKKATTPETKTATVTEAATTIAAAAGTEIKVPEAPLTLATCLNTFEKELSPSESREVSAATKVVIEKMQAAASNMLEVGNRLVELRNSIGAGKFWRYVREVLAKARIMSESNVGLWMGRANVLKESIPNEHIRQQLLTIGNGQNIVVRVEPTEDEKKEGATSKYVLSPFIAAAIEKLPHPPKGKLNTEAAETYARQVIAVSNQLRSQARTPGDDTARMTAKRANIAKQFNAYLDAFGAPQAAQLLKTCFAAYCRKAKMDDAESLVGSLDKVLESARDAGINGDVETETPRTSKANKAKAA